MAEKKIKPLYWDKSGMDKSMLQRMEEGMRRFMKQDDSNIRSSRGSPGSFHDPKMEDMQKDMTNKNAPAGKEKHMKDMED